jgi:hypothetical protein
MQRYTRLFICMAVVVLLLWLFNPGTKGSHSKVYYQPIRGYTKPVGRESKGEMECRRILESLFKRPFPKIRPSFLKNPHTGRNLELDAYNADLKIGLEYNGRQHYTHHAFFHSSNNDLNTQRQRDAIKKRLCQKHGVLLIEIPYWEKNIEKSILQQLKARYK